MPELAGEASGLESLGTAFQQGGILVAMEGYQAKRSPMALGLLNDLLLQPVPAGGSQQWGGSPAKADGPCGGAAAAGAAGGVSWGKGPHGISTHGSLEAPGGGHGG